MINRPILSVLLAIMLALGIICGSVSTAFAADETAEDIPLKPEASNYWIIVQPIK